MSGDRPQEDQPVPDQAVELAQADAQNLASQSGIGSGTAMSLDFLLAPGALAGTSGYNPAGEGDTQTSSVPDVTRAGQATQAPDLRPPRQDPTSQPENSQADTGRLTNSANAADSAESGTGMPLDFQALLAQPGQSPAPAVDQPGSTDSAPDTGNHPPDQRTGPPDNLPPLAPEPPPFQPARETWSENQLERAAQEPGRNETNKTNDGDSAPGNPDRDQKGQDHHPRTRKGKEEGAAGATSDKTPRGAADRHPGASPESGAADPRPTGNESQNSGPGTGHKLVEGVGSAASVVEHGISGARDLLDSAATLQKVAERLNEMKPAPDFVVRGAWSIQDRAAALTGRTDIQALKGAADSKVAGGLLKFATSVGALAEGTLAYLTARDSGSSRTKALLHDGVPAGITEFVENGWKGTAVEAAYAITKSISPRAAEYVKPVGELSPKSVAMDDIRSTIDTFSALASGDTKRVIATHENRLAGGYHEHLRGLAILADLVAATIMHDQRGMSELSDMAAAGQLEFLPQVGDRLGSAIFDLTHRNR
jgi:hypothetical protein